MITYGQLQTLSPRGKHRLAGLMKQLSTPSEKYPTSEDPALSNNDMIDLLNALGKEVEDLHLSDTKGIWLRLKHALEGTL